MKKKTMGILMLVSSALIVLLSFHGLRLINALAGGSMGAKVFLGAAYYVLYGLYALAVVLFLCWSIKNAKGHPILTVLAALSVAASVLLCVVLPFSPLYAKLHLALFEEDMLAAAEAISEGELTENQIGPNKFLAPNQFSSFDGRIYAEGQGKAMNAQFSLYRSPLRGEASLVYSPDDTAPSGSDFRYELRRRVVKKLDACWYLLLES